MTPSMLFRMSGSDTDDASLTEGSSGSELLGMKTSGWLHFEAFDVDTDFGLKGRFDPFFLSVRLVTANNLLSSITSYVSKVIINRIMHGSFKFNLHDKLLSLARLRFVLNFPRIYNNFSKKLSY